MAHFLVQGVFVERSLYFREFLSSERAHLISMWMIPNGDGFAHAFWRRLINVRHLVIYGLQNQIIGKISTVSKHFWKVGRNDSWKKCTPKCWRHRNRLNTKRRLVFVMKSGFLNGFTNVVILRNMCSRRCFLLIRKKDSLVLRKYWVFLGHRES